jgi:hypothetical protein
MKLQLLVVGKPAECSVLFHFPGQPPTIVTTTSRSGNKDDPSSNLRKPSREAMPSSKGSADYGGNNSGDTAFIIICGCLVLLMALPGIVLFYGRLPRPSFLLAFGWPRSGGRTFRSDVAAAPRAGLRARAPRPVAHVPFGAHASYVLNVSSGRWTHRLQEMHVHMHSDLCRCQLDLHNLADVRLLACVWA